jgi:cell division protein FtsB
VRPRSSAGSRTTLRIATAAVLAVAGLLIVRVLVADDGYPALLSRRAYLARIEAEVARIRLANEELEREVRTLRTDPMAVERIAREELDLVAPGEWTYLFPPDLPVADPEAGSRSEGAGEGR